MRARPSPGKGRDTHVGLQTRKGIQAAAQEQVCGCRKPAAPWPVLGGQHQKGGWRGRVMGKRQPGLVPEFPVLLAFGAPADGGHVPGTLRMFPATPSSVCHPDSRLEASQAKEKAGVAGESGKAGVVMLQHPHTWGETDLSGGSPAGPLQQEPCVDWGHLPSQPPWPQGRQSFSMQGMGVKDFHWVRSFPSETPGPQHRGGPPSSVRAYGVTPPPP